jgi:hypothetical protein
MYLGDLRKALGEAVELTAGTTTLFDDGRARLHHTVTR